MGDGRRGVQGQDSWGSQVLCRGEVANERGARESCFRESRGLVRCRLCQGTLEDKSCWGWSEGRRGPGQNRPRRAQR